MKKESRMKELQEVLKRAAEAYYTLDDSIMSDMEYDALYDGLLALEEETGIVMGGSITQTVGYKMLDGFEKEKHATKMLSLNKTKSVDELAEWLGNHKGFLSFKLDGLTVVLTYEDGLLKKAVTRGTGEVGEVITENARMFNNVPSKIPHKGKLVIRGEAIITYTEFDRINAELDDDNKYKNPRNLCSGTVRQLNTKVTASRNVEFIAFHVVDSESIGPTDNSYSDKLAQIESLGFKSVYGLLVDKNTLKSSIKHFEELVANKADTPSDGLVLYLDDISYGISLGCTSKFPRAGMAFKWKDELAETTLRDIEWSASRTGLLNPVAIFDTVELEGTSVSRASLHNVSIIEKLSLNIGNTITCYKANMIIPQVASNLSSDVFNPDVIPSTCPICSGDTKINSSVNSSTKEVIKTLYCVNEHCSAKSVGRFEHFVARDAFNIVGLSSATLEKFVQLGFLVNLSDIFKLSDYKAEIINLEGFGQKSYDKLISSIESAKSIEAHKVIYSLGLEHIGRSASKLILENCNHDISELIAVTEDKLLSIDGIGDAMAKCMVDYFNNDENKAELLNILSYLNIESISVDTNSWIAGKSFVITGSLDRMSRNELKKHIEGKGGKVVGSVSKNTDYLINNDKESSSSKNKKAKELNIAILNEDDFFSM